MGEVWLFLLGVNFWNVLGAGLMGPMINLPVINYYEHATFFTVGHAHGAMFGVKGNIALGSILYCGNGPCVTASPMVKTPFAMASSLGAGICASL